MFRFINTDYRFYLSPALPYQDMAGSFRSVEAYLASDPLTETEFFIYDGSN